MLTQTTSPTLQLDEQASTETYKDIQNIIGYQIKMFSRRYRYLQVAREDLVSLANEVFMEVYASFDLTKEYPFHKYLSFKVWNRFLQEYPQKESRQHRRKMGKVNTVDMTELEIKAPYSSFSLSNFISDLTEDAGMITKLITDAPSDLALAMRLDSPKPNGTTCRSCLRHYLLGLGWTAQRITNSFKEISLALN